jgi:hypothetical protein
MKYILTVLLVKIVPLSNPLLLREVQIFYEIEDSQGQGDMYLSTNSAFHCSVFHV